MSEISREILSVGDLNRAIAQSLEDRFDTVWVSGEVSNFKAYDSGHWYFSLKDAQAQVRCAMFRPKNQYLPFKPDNGQQVLARAPEAIVELRGPMTPGRLDADAPAVGHCAP